MNYCSFDIEKQEPVGYSNPVFPIYCIGLSIFSGVAKLCWDFFIGGKEARIGAKKNEK